MTKGERTSEPKVRRAGSEVYEPLDESATYRVAGYYFDAIAGKIGPIDADGDVDVVRDGGDAVDITQLVARYLAENHVSEVPSLIELAGSLPDPLYGNPEIQPLRGA